MAVSNSDITRLEGQRRALQNRMSELNRAITQQTRAANERYERKLAQIVNDSNRQLQEREQAIRELYDEMLMRTLTEEEENIQRQFYEQQQQYEQVCADLSVAKAKFARRAEEAALRQNEFEKAYYSRKEAERQLAEQICRNTDEEYRQLSSDLPMEWFMPGHLGLYKSRIDKMREHIGNQWYETASAAGENVSLNMRLDRIEVNDRLSRWTNIFLVVSRLIERAGELLYTEASILSAGLDGTAAVFRIKGRKISEEYLDSWTNGEYSELCGVYNSLYERLSPFRENGKIIGTDKLVAFMQNNYEKYSARFREIDLYMLKRELDKLIDDGVVCIRSLRGMLTAFEERRNMISDETEHGIETLLLNGGYDNFSVRISGSGRPDSPFIIEFTDSFNERAFEIVLTPVMRKFDGSWIHFVDWFHPNDIGADTVEELTHIMANAFIERGILVKRHIMSYRQSSDDRARETYISKMLLINGRIN